VPGIAALIKAHNLCCPDCGDGLAAYDVLMISEPWIDNGGIEPTLGGAKVGRRAAKVPRRRRGKKNGRTGLTAATRRQQEKKDM
jgi:hypothetical protein